jgi:hypothetical protein
MARQMPYVGELGSMQRLIASLEANRADLGHLEGSLTQFGELVAKTQDLAKQQAALTAAKQDVSQQLKVQIVEGLRLATLLRVALRQHYGIRSEKLAEFGLQPFRGRNRKASSPAPEIPEPPAPADPNPTTPADPSR